MAIWVLTLVAFLFYYFDNYNFIFNRTQGNFRTLNLERNNIVYFRTHYAIGETVDRNFLCNLKIDLV